jgi:CheY-like chemotaxis protein
MLGGDIAVQSRPGLGSRFILTIHTGNLQGIALRDGREAVLPVPEQSDAPRSVRLQGRVLLAEDGVNNQLVISYYLQKAGLEVEIADNGHIACDKALGALAEGKAFDLILMDMQMPELDGYGAATKLRSKGYAGPIIALTAHAMTHDRDKCLRGGCSEYLSKPIEKVKLITTIAAVLNSKCCRSTRTAFSWPDLSSTWHTPQYD